MKSRYIVFILASFVFYGCKLNVQNVTFEDDAFKSYCISLFDQNNDKEISLTEAQDIKSISIITSNINSLKGIESFVNLEELICSDNSLTEIDVRNNSALRILNCGDNQIKELDVSHNSNLTELVCCNNELAQLDVTYNPSLYILDCMKNNLTSLDISKNTALEILVCDYNHLFSLDLCNNPNLSTLTCYDNPELKEIRLLNGHTFQTLNISNTEAELIFKD